ncbi:MAG: hypothetical protein ACPGGK_17340 [Pikeienuella sp.]
MFNPDYVSGKGDFPVGFGPALPIRVAKTLPNSDFKCNYVANIYQYIRHVLAAAAAYIRALVGEPDGNAGRSGSG